MPLRGPFHRHLRLSHHQQFDLQHVLGHAQFVDLQMARLRQRCAFKLHKNLQRRDGSVGFGHCSDSHRGTGYGDYGVGMVGRDEVEKKQRWWS